MTEKEVTIIEEMEERSCHTCGVRFASGKQSMIEGKEKAMRDRTAICIRCEHHPNMALVQRIGGNLVTKLVGEIIDNWRPITDEDKCCQTCRISRTVNAMGNCKEARVIVENQCLFCKYSKNAAIIKAKNEQEGLGSELEDHWMNFEG